MKNHLLALCAGLAVLQACQPDEKTLKEVSLELPETPYTYELAPNNELPTLGRVLFYDKQLSLNNSVSCSSCHKQTLAFADNTALSRGYENRQTLRNSMPIQNLQGAFETGGGGLSLFWDGREKMLPVMVLKPIVNHVEMGIDDLEALSKKLQKAPYYRELFTDAYGTADVTPEKIGEALSSFIGSISSRNTKFDRFLNSSGQLSPLEVEGQKLFVEKYGCNNCHQVNDPEGYIFAGTFANIGLDVAYTDNGRNNVTAQEWDKGSFKIPSLRNVALTAPYMHDGRFKTLDDVIEHYSTGIQDNPNLDFRLRTDGQPAKFNISLQETQAIIAFLNTLTDQGMISDPKFSDPFKIK
jgi:cytochrome c peroxidase